MNSQSRLGELVEAFEADRNSVLRSLYLLFRADFIVFSKKMCSDTELCLDSFQEAVISVYENLTQNKITRDDASIKTYLFAIGKNKLLTAMKKQHTVTFTDKVAPGEQHDNSNPDTDLKVALQLAFDQLGDTCQEILKKFYFHRYAIESIMIDMQYKNENTVKAHKSRCISKLRKVMMQNLKSSN